MYFNCRSLDQGGLIRPFVLRSGMLNPLLQRSAPAAPATWRVFTALQRPTAALHTRAPLDLPHPKKINSLISRSTSARELLGLHAKYGEAFDSIHLATCWSRLGKVSASDRTWLRSDNGAQLVALRGQTADRAGVEFWRPSRV